MTLGLFLSLSLLGTEHRPAGMLQKYSVPELHVRPRTSANIYLAQDDDFSL